MQQSVNELAFYLLSRCVSNYPPQGPIKGKEILEVFIHHHPLPETMIVHQILDTKSKCLLPAGNPATYGIVAQNQGERVEARKMKERNRRTVLVHMLKLDRMKSPSLLPVKFGESE